MNKMHRAFAAHGPQQTRSFADQWPLQPIVYRGKLVYLYSITCQMLAAAASVCCLAQNAMENAKAAEEGGRPIWLRSHIFNHISLIHSILSCQFNFSLVLTTQPAKLFSSSPAALIFSIAVRNTDYRLCSFG